MTASGTARESARHADGKFGTQGNPAPIRGLADDEERLVSINDELSGLARGLGITEDTIGEREFDGLIDNVTHMVNYQLGDPSGASMWPIGFPVSEEGGKPPQTGEKIIEISDWVHSVVRENGITDEAVGDQIFDQWTDTVTRGVCAHLEAAQSDNVCDTDGCYESLNDGEGSDGHCGTCADAMTCRECGVISDLSCTGEPMLCSDCCAEDHGH